MTKEQLAEKLRKKLKDEREQSGDGNNDQSTSGTNQDTDQYTGNITFTDGSSFQSVSGPSTGTRSNKRLIDRIDKRRTSSTGSSAQIDQRLRPTTGRSSQNNSQSGPDGTDLSSSPERPPSRTVIKREVGNLVAEDSIPERNFTAANTQPETETATPKSEAKRIAPARKGGGSSKSGVNGNAQEKQPEERENENKNKFFSGKTTLSSAEAKIYLEPLIQFLSDSDDNLDKLLWKMNGDVTQQPIWSDITEKENRAFATLLLKRGQRSPATATVVRGMIDAQDYITVGMMLGPRLKQTFDIVRSSRRNSMKEKVSRRERRDRLKAIRDQ